MGQAAIHASEDLGIVACAKVRLLDEQLEFLRPGAFLLGLEGQDAVAVGVHRRSRQLVRNHAQGRHAVPAGVSAVVGDQGHAQERGFFGWVLGPTLGHGLEVGSCCLQITVQARCSPASSVTTAINSSSLPWAR